MTPTDINQILQDQFGSKIKTWKADAIDPYVEQ